MDVQQQYKQFSAINALTILLQEFSAIADHRTLRDSLPRRLVHLLACRGALIYLRTDKTLQLVSGAFDDEPGWSASLLAIAHINPIGMNSTVLEARAWRDQCSIGMPDLQPDRIAIPLLNREHCIGVLVVVRGCDLKKPELPISWSAGEIEQLQPLAGIVALLLEHTRLRERDRQRIHELSLLNSISSQLHNSLYEKERLRSVVVQRTREICGVDLCVLLEPGEPPEFPALLTEAPADEGIEGEEGAWVTPELHDWLFQWSSVRRSPMPLIIERPEYQHDPDLMNCLKLLPPAIKTFFAIPLFSGRSLNRAVSHHRSNTTIPDMPSSPKILGLIVGGYTRVRKLNHAELALLQVLVSQVSSVLENMYLMTEVIEARNEARRLLRQVLDDRRQKDLILESIPSGLITTDSEGRIDTFNRAAATILGYHPYEVLGLPLRRFLNLPMLPASPLDVAPIVIGEVHNRAGIKRMEHDIQHLSLMLCDRFERERMLEVDVLPLYGEQGEHIGMLTTFNDMTAVHHLEEEKRRLDRLATLGEMAANVAHEVRNPLASIKTSIQLVRSDLAADGAVGVGSGTQESIDVALKEVERLDVIVRDLLLFARPRQLHRVRCDLKSACEQVLKLLRIQCRDASVTTHCNDEDTPPLWLDMVQIEQILLNLCLNAIQAMPEGGILSLAGRRIQSPVSDKNTYQWVELSISDTGAGIAPDQLEHIFQPFYTTKAHGIGLGLSITRRLIEDHGGHIRLESQLGYGTTVIIHLPLINAPDLPEEQLPGSGLVIGSSDYRG